MIYTVKYKLQNQWFWRNLKKVKGDISADINGIALRVFILEDESRVEVPVHGTSFSFSKERFFVIKRNMESEARQPIQVNQG